LGIVSCKQESIPKPDNLLSKEQMANMLYDITLINAMKGVDKRKLDSSILHFDTYLYKKHKTDSAQFAISNNYYAANPLKYNEIYGMVSARLEKERKVVDKKMEAEKQRRDSLQKAKKEEQIKRKKLGDTLPVRKFNEAKKVKAE
jgi:hypothetical protein